jgi:cyclopropane fatty-acyl-phospholipid synthase-like methyltransferase
MNMSDIPRSTWVIDRVYFTAKPVNDFFSEYKRWLEIEGNLFTASVSCFAEKISKNNFIQLYQFPQKRTDIEHDYFELLDDNHVIPRHLFTLINQAINT